MSEIDGDAIIEWRNIGWENRYKFMHKLNKQHTVLEIHVEWL